MPIDFDWQEGSHRFDLDAVQVQPRPAPAALPTVRRAAAPSRQAPRLSNLTLLIVGVALGVVAGFVLLTYEGQRNARADVAPAVGLQHEALMKGDAELYRGSLDGSDPVWQATMVDRMALSAWLSDSGAPRVRQVSLQGDHAEVDVLFDYDGRTYRRLEAMRLQGDEWLQTSDPVGEWGALQTATGAHVTLNYRERDAFVGALLPRMDAAVQAFCARYKMPAPCRLEVSIEPDPALLPFVPGGGSPGFLAASSVDTVAAASAVRIVSPRLVGWRGKEPHPLWWLALHETLGEAILARTLAAASGEGRTAGLLWAAARGDVAIWAERMSGVALPTFDLPSMTDPAQVGTALAAGDASQRNAARDFALFLHVVIGESGLLAAVEQSLNTESGAATLFGQTPEALAASWQSWRAGRQEQAPEP